MPQYTDPSNLLCAQDNSVLLIIDIQTRLTATMPINVLARLKRNSQLLINAAKILEIPVFVSEQYPKGLGPLEPEITELLPENTRKFEKTCFSCAGAENFIDQLTQTGRKQVILAGIEAHVCILQTAFDLKNTGYDIFVAVDCVCSRNRENYENALYRMSRSGINMSSTESIIFEWLKDAKHDKFKDVSALIK